MDKIKAYEYAALKGIFCSGCKDVVEFITKAVVKGGSCTAGEALITGAFTAAEIAFPELDWMLPELETAFDVTWSAVCSEMNFKWIEENINEFSKKVCESAKIC